MPHNLRANKADAPDVDVAVFVRGLAPDVRLQLQIQI